MNNTLDTEVDKDEGQQKTDVSSYLQAPRKKRKNFVVIATSDKTDPALIGQIEGLVRKQFSHLAVSRPKNLHELSRQFSRSISLLIVDDKIDSLENLMNMVNTLKVKSKKDVAPVLFLTTDPPKLIEAYRKKLAVYQESDDFCDMGRLEHKQILGRVNHGIEAKNRRRSRRFKVDIDLNFFHLSSNKEYKGKLIDLSIHGALLHSSEISQFRLGEQLKIIIPTSNVLSITGGGEFLRMSAKVRRVYMAGDVAGISFEHVTDIQSDRLMTYLANYARDFFAR